MFAYSKFIYLFIYLNILGLLFWTQKTVTIPLLISAMITLETKIANTFGAKYYTQKTCCWLEITHHDERATKICSSLTL
jgi:hypothetical protein